ncbi:TPA: hypothetical protein HA265_03345 [Candidatus Woesearchaeota archaeon]|nr:hypothetical protein [Candidatus Woesearchaeota archaeon]
MSDIEDKFWKGGLIIKVKHQDDDWQEDTMVWMREEEKPKAMMLKKGEQITYVAKMNGLSTILFPYRLSDGTLVK